jgi:hypothetical protein
MAPYELNSTEMKRNTSRKLLRDLPNPPDPFSTPKRQTTSKIAKPKHKLSVHSIIPKEKTTNNLKKGFHDLPLKPRRIHTLLLWLWGPSALRRFPLLWVWCVYLTLTSFFQPHLQPQE